MPNEARFVLEGYRFMKPQRVAFRDLDYFRHVNNAAYITWTESLRIEYMVEVLGVPLDARIGIIMASQQFDYKYAVSYGEEILVGCRVPKLGTKSFVLEFEVWSSTAHKLAAHGFNTIVAYDYQEQRSVAIPPEWRTTIEAFEGQSLAR